MAALYAKQMNEEINKKISELKKKSGLSKWLIVENLLANALKIDTPNKINLKKWMKKK